MTETNIPTYGNKVSKWPVREYDLIPDGDYPARITRFIGLGVQEQPDFQGTSKDPAFKAMFEFELIGVDISGTEIANKGSDEETRTPLEPLPSCQFYDVFLFPNGSRGKVFDICKILDPSVEKVPRTLEWFESKLGTIVNVNIGRYTIKNGPNAGKERNTVRTVSAIPKMFQSQVGEARRPLVFFNPYVETDKMFAAYSDLFFYQRTMLEEAIDSEVIVYSGMEPGKNTATAQVNTDSDSKTPVEDDDIPF